MPERALELLNMKAADKNGMPVIPFLCCRDIASVCGMSPRDVEITALKNGICPSRYERSIGTFGMNGQASLLEARVAVVGCGGLGGWIIEILARAGVGEIVMIDGDVFDDNNLNRQLFSEEANIGMAKAEAAAFRVGKINGALTTRPIVDYINKDNGMWMLNGCSVVVDALDNNSGRKCVMDICRKLEIPFVHGAIGGYFGQVAVLYPKDRAFWEGSNTPDKGIELKTGNPPFTPAFIAAVQAAEAIKIVTSSDGRLSGELLWFDLMGHVQQRIKL